MSSASAQTIVGLSESASLAERLPRVEPISAAQAHSNKAGSSHGAPHEPSITVSGGIRVRTEDLDAAASKLDCVGQMVGHLEAELRVLAVEAGTLETPIVVAVGALIELGERIDRAWRGLRCAAANYEESEMVKFASMTDPFVWGLNTGPTGHLGIAALVKALRTGMAWMRERDVEVHEVAANPAEREKMAKTKAPDGFSDLADRVSGGGHDDAQVRIERYEGEDGCSRWVVYVSGTRTFAPNAGSEPFDLLSDAGEVASEVSGARATTEKAMAAAGVREGDSVAFVGYSLGGLVTTSLVQSGRYRVPTLVTFGSPTRAAHLPGSVRVVSVEHSDDPVPYTGGLERLPQAGKDDRTVVSRHSRDGAASSGFFDPHDIARYKETARRMDQAPDVRLEAAETALAELTGGRPPTTTYWKGVRP